MIGEQFSHYRILQELGAGGMGVVYKAEDLKLGRQVAVKFLPPHLVEDREAQERFQREARTASALNHPGICTIYEIDEHNGRPFIAMELLEGDPLNRLIAGVPLPLSVLVDYAVQISDALDAAHGQGVLHRDIKPANIFITRRSQVKVLDFGLAKLTRRAHDQSDLTEVLGEGFHTTTGMTLGTVAYMSPEQARGELLDHRSDLFSFGVVLYEMATGQQTFAGTTSAVVFDAILNRMPLAPMEVNAAVPADLERVIAKAIEKDRQLRYQTASDMRADLQRLRRDLDSGAAVQAGASSPSVTTSASWPSMHLSGAKTVVLPPPSEARRQASEARVRGALGAAILVATGAGLTYFAIAQRSSEPTPRGGTPVKTATGPAAAHAPPAAPGQTAPPAQGGATGGSTPGPLANDPKGAEKGPAATAASGRSLRKGEDPGERIRIARAKADARLYDQALADARAIVRDYPSSPMTADAYLVIGSVQEQQGQFEAAMATYVEARNRFKTAVQSAEAGYRLADLMMQSGRRDRAAPARDTLTDVAANHSTTEWAPRALALRARLEDRENLRQTEPRLGSIPAAVVTLRTLAEQYPMHPLAEQALWRMAQTYADLRRPEMAADALKTLVTRFPQTRLDAWWQLGELYDKRLDDKQKARDAYARVPATSPRYTQARKKVK